MHRTFSVPRLIGWGKLLAVLSLLAGVYAVYAQSPAPGQTRSAVIELAVGTSRTCQMTTQADLKRVENPNSNVVRVERIADKNNAILLIAEQPGRTIITFTDQKDRVEVHEIIVAAAAAPVALPLAPEARPAVHMAQPLAEVQQLQINITRDPKGNIIPAFRSIRLPEVPVGGIVVENSGIVTVFSAKEDLSVVTFRAVAVGRSRVTFYYDVAKTRADIFEVTVGEGDVALGVHTVELHVIVAVVNRSEARNMSFSFLHNSSSNNWFLGSLLGGPANLASAFAVSPAAASLTGTGANLPFGVFNANGGTLGFLNALRTEGLTKILAEPRLVTLSGRPANILSGGNVQIVAAGGISSAQISADFGTIVNFLPIVKPNGKIYLEVRPEVSTPTDTIPIPGAGGAGTVTFSVLKRSAQVSVEMEDGQTLAIGGLIQNRVDSTTNKVPFLGDMPFFGAAFRSVSALEIEEEMIILVTPRLVHPVDCTKIPRYLPGRETRNADDFELFLEGIMEAPRGQRNVVFHPHMYKASHHYASNAGQIPCGDAGCHARGGCSNGNCSTHQNHHATLPTSGGSVVARPQPMPSFPEVPAMPTSNTRINVEPELPGTLPPMRDTAPNLGPLMPTSPVMPPSRQQLPTPVLPPLSMPPAGR